MEQANRRVLGNRNIEVKDRLIVALDLPSTDEAKAIVEELGDSVTFYKLGLELFMAGKYVELTEWLRKRDKKVFVDLKFFDIANTVAGAVAKLKHYGAYFASVHGNDDMLKAAVGEQNSVIIIAVTVLTSLDQNDIEELGFKCSVKDLILSRARRALDIGCGGVLSSGLEVHDLRRHCGDSFIIVVPGVRPVLNSELNTAIFDEDQARTVTVEHALQAGADYVVVGRPITRATSPRAVAEAIQDSIQKLFRVT